jgi:hypothetical protein
MNAGHCFNGRRDMVERSFRLLQGLAAAIEDTVHTMLMCVFVR